MPEHIPVSFEGAVSGLYAITPDEADTDRLVAGVTAALAGGLRWIQYRNKKAPETLQKEQALAIRTLCQRYAAMLIINDHPGLARDIDAAGAHIGALDSDLASARDTIGAARILGVSCYADVALALSAERAGANYVAFGSMFHSPTKPNAPHAPLSVFKAARAHGVRLPLVAIGGITLENVHQLIAAGANAVAIIAGVFSDLDPISVQARTSALINRIAV